MVLAYLGWKDGLHWKCGLGARNYQLQVSTKDLVKCCVNQ
jgi:hypothetical protein